jgi:pimeloyl-ACP methyl ester carboxylesterase
VARKVVSMRWAVLLALLVGGSGCGEDTVGGVLVTARTAEGATLRASYQRPDADTPQQTLLLVHQPGEGHGRMDWARIWDPLVDVGYGVLAIDLRSHGSSDDAGEPDALANDPGAFTRDIEIWLEYIQEREDEGEAVSVNRTGIIGLGASGSLAAAAVASGRARCAVAYSPSIAGVNRYFEGWNGEPDNDPGDALRDDIQLSTTFWLSADADEPSADDVAVLHDATEGETGLLVTEGIHHGLELLELNDSTLGVAVDWCADKL